MKSGVFSNGPRLVPGSLVCALLLMALLLSGSRVAALSDLRLAAEQGDCNAQYELGYRVLKAKGQKPDYREVVKWFRRAAEQGHAEAQYGLALRYLFGQGVEKNFSVAVDWLQKAAEQGHADAQLSLGLRYYWGQGIDKDHELARHWFEKAAAQGQAEVRQYLASLQLERQEPRDDLENWIAEYAEILLSAAGPSEPQLQRKEQLEGLLTVKEIMQAFQRASAIKDQRTDPRQQVATYLTTLAQRQPTAEGYFREGNRQLHEGQLPLAIAAYQQSLELNPENPNCYQNLASTYAHTGQFDLAIEMLRKSIALDSGWADKHATLGLLYDLKQNRTAALAEYRTAARLNPGLGWVYPDMAAIFMQQQQYAAAGKALRQAELLGHGKPRLSARLATLAPALAQPKPSDDIRLRQLVLPNRQSAEQALAELNGGRDFSSLAQAVSIPRYNRNGGYWGRYQPDQLAPSFRVPLKKLPLLAFSPIIETTEGFHILQKFPVIPELLADGGSSGPDRSRVGSGAY
ncbi:MAG: tetratricopeptide repeat protein [Desulfuromonadaceae bacterium]